MSYIAPAGTPLSLYELAAGLSSGLLDGRATGELEENLTRLTATRRCHLMSSGRAALVLALRAMQRASGDPRRTEVIIPAYTCYSVPAAVHRAGLQPRLCDLDPATLDLDLQSLAQRDFSRVLAVVSTAIYGIPNSLAQIEHIAGEHGVFLIDDAAQSLGARHAGRPAGGFGDAGIVSFEKGKNLTTLKGGALVTRSEELARHIEAEYASLPAAAFAATAAACIKLPLYALCLHPIAYSIVRRMPGLALGLSLYETDFPMTRYSGVLAGLAARLCARLRELNAQRNRNAERLEDALRGLDSVRLLTHLADTQPAYVRLPVFFASAARRAAALDALDRAGIGASASYPQALCDLAELKPLLGPDDAHMPGAREIASSIVTLPTHPSCPPELALRIRSVLEDTQAAGVR